MAGHHRYTEDRTLSRGEKEPCFKTKSMTLGLFRANDVPLPRQIDVDLLEQRLHHPRLREPLGIEPDGLGVRHPVC